MTSGSESTSFTWIPAGSTKPNRKPKGNQEKTKGKPKENAHHGGKPTKRKPTHNPKNRQTQKIAKQSSGRPSKKSAPRFLCTSPLRASQVPQSVLRGRQGQRFSEDLRGFKRRFVWVLPFGGGQNRFDHQMGEFTNPKMGSTKTVLTTTAMWVGCGCQNRCYGFGW